MRSLSEERAEADIAALEAHLNELMVANKFEECDELQERIDQMKKAQTDISGLKAQLEDAKRSRDFKGCRQIQKQIDELNVTFSEQVIPNSSVVCRNVQCTHGCWSSTGHSRQQWRQQVWSSSSGR